MAALKRGSKGEDVKKLQGGLLGLGYHPGTVDEIFGGATEEAAEDFQRDNGLVPDGVVGKGTLAAYNPQVGAEYQIHWAVAPDPAPPVRLSKWVTVPCHKHKDGFATTTLREDAAVAFTRLYAEVTALGGKLTSAGGKRPLNVGGGSAQSKTSLHYIGRAHDLSLSSGMQNPSLDPIVVCRRTPGDVTDRRWVLWMRTDNPAVPEVTLQGVRCRSVKNSKGAYVTILDYIPVTGRFFNFTELAARYGWVPISGRRSFFKGGSYTSAEWWHFQWEEGLVKGESTFGAELLRLYPLSDAQKFKFWGEAKDAVWGEDFN